MASKFSAIYAGAASRREPSGARPAVFPEEHRRIATCPAALPSLPHASPRMARPLTLHLSALSDDEYTLYTSSLSEISSPPSSPSSSTPKDAYWEDRIVSLREARGWMRGRYGVEGGVIDTVRALPLQCVFAACERLTSCGFTDPQDVLPDVRPDRHANLRPILCSHAARVVCPTRRAA